MATQEELAKRYSEQVSGVVKSNMGKTGGIVREAQKTTKATPKKPMDLVDKATAVAQQTGSVISQGVQQVGGFLGGVAKSTLNNIALTGRSIVEAQTQQIQNSNLVMANKNLEKKQTEIVSAYRAGKMSKENYNKSLRDLSKSYSDIARESQEISSGPTPEQRALAVVDTAATALTLGSLQLGKVAASGGKVAIENLIAQNATKLEKVISTVPAVKDLLIRNAEKLVKTQAQKAAGETVTQLVTRESKKVATALLIKKPIFYELNVGDAQNVYNELLSGKTDAAIRDAAWLSTQMLSGGPIGAAFKGFSWLKGKTHELSYGKGSVIDELSKRIGDGKSNQITKYLNDLPPDEFKKHESTYRILQETNLKVADENVQEAAENILRNYDHAGIDRKTLTPQQLAEDYAKWREADVIVNDLRKVQGLTNQEIDNMVVVRWDSIMKQGLADAIEKAGSNKQNQLDAVRELADRPGVGWGNNPTLLAQIDKAIFSGKSAKEAADSIRAIPTAAAIPKNIPKRVADKLAKLGYGVALPASGTRKTPFVNYDDTRKLITGAIKGDSETFDIATAPQPQLAYIAQGLERAGISPNAANNVANRKLSEAVVANLDEANLSSSLGLTGHINQDVVTGGRVILSKLQSYVENKQPFMKLGKSAAITDIRQLTTKEVQEALGVTNSEAKVIQESITDAYLKVPLEFRGIGDKITDTLYKYNPAYKYYSRIQSALRYTYNPFFRTQERVETALLTRATSGNLIWGKSRQELNEGVSKLDQSGIFSSSLPGEAAGENVLGRISANLTQAQKRDLAGMSYKMAEARGMSLDKMIAEHSDEIDDALRVIVQYPRKGVLASNLARTMNLAFFPMRYNTKVTMLAGQILSKQPPTVQMAVLNSMFDMKNWLNSDEGIRWQATHSDALQVLNWLTPIGSIQYTMKLLSGEAQSISDLGALGGLPLGVVTQMLDSQGIVQLNTPYVDPKSGDVIPKYIPESLKARAAVAIGDLLGSLFTYPGRTLGLPGKAESIRNAVKAFIATEGEDFDKRIDMDRLTPLQQNYIRVLKGDLSDEAIDKLYTSPLEGQVGPTIPPLALPIRPPSQIRKIEKRRGLPSRSGDSSSSSKSKKTKKIAASLAS